MNQKIQKHLDEMYKGEKSRKFVQHLLRAYIPVSNVEKIWGAPMRNYRCCLSEQPLAGANSVLEVINHKANTQKLVDYLVEPFSNKTMGEYKIVTDLFTKKPLGVKGKNTETYMSLPMFNEFHQWVLGKIVDGDSGINEAISEFRNEDMLVSASKLAKTDKEIKRIETLIKKAKITTKKQAERVIKFKEREAEREEQKTTLGDFISGDLAALKAKMD